MMTFVFLSTFFASAGSGMGREKWRLRESVFGSKFLSLVSGRLGRLYIYTFCFEVITHRLASDTADGVRWTDDVCF